MVRYFILLGLLCAACPAQAAEKSMMKTMIITPPEAADADNKAAENGNDAADDTETPADRPITPAIHADALNESGKQLPYFAPTSQLTRWPHLQNLFLPPETSEFQAAVAAASQTPELVPPQGWIQLAGVMVDQGRMGDAALYHQLGLLRAAFDAKRFPDTPPRDAYLKKVGAQAAELNEPVYRYMLESPEQLEKTLMKLVAFDKATRYAYDPGFPFPAELKGGKTGLKLVETRKEFVGRWVQSAKTLWPTKAGALYKNLSKILDK